MTLSKRYCLPYRSYLTILLDSVNHLVKHQHQSRFLYLRETGICFIVMDMTSVISDIKNGNIADLYLFYGEEAYKKRHLKELLKKTVTGGNLMNYSSFAGKDINWQEVYDATQTLPFFAPRRLVIVENSGKFKAGKAEGDGKEDHTSALLEKILKELPATACLAFFEEDAAKNRKTYKAAAARGVVLECREDAQSDVINWLARGFAQEGKKVRRSTLDLLIERVGVSYDSLRAEFEKIISYAGERTVIEDADVLAVSSQTIQSRIFDMLSAMCSKNTAKVLELYRDLLLNREHPLYILAMLRSQFRTMLQVAELSRQGKSSAGIARDLGKPAFVINRTLGYLRYFRPEQMEQILDEISETDRKCKSGEIQDQIGVELMLIRFSG